jgi:hypothetical protein
MIPLHAATMSARKPDWNPSSQTAGAVSAHHMIRSSVRSLRWWQGNAVMETSASSPSMITPMPLARCFTRWRLEPKSFRQRRPDGNGGWIWELDGRRALYHWPELLKYPDGTVFICEGEKDADRVGGLGHCATCVAAGKWTEECATALSGRDVIILEDNDAAGRVKALAAAQALHGTAKTIRIVSLPDLSDKGDVSDWLDADPRRAEKLVDVCFDVPVWTPDDVAANATTEAAAKDTRAAFQLRASRQVSRRRCRLSTSPDGMARRRRNANGWCRTAYR